MIWNFVPYCPADEGEGKFVGKDLGAMYNRYVELLPSGDWVCFLDHDVMQTTRYWYRLLEQATKAKPNAGAFVAVASRLSLTRSSWQMAGEAMSTCDDMTVHWQEGHSRYAKYGAETVDVTHIEDPPNANINRVTPLSGAAFCVSVDVWRAIGGAPSGFTQVDWRIHRRMRDSGYEVHLLPGWYVYHWFRRIPETK